MCLPESARRAVLDVRANPLQMQPLMEQVYAMDGPSFELFTATLLRMSGWKPQVIGGSGDGGIDIDALRHGGSERLLVQCKRHNVPVGPAVIRQMLGSLHITNDPRASALVVTTSTFSAQAIATAQTHPRLRLVNRKRLRAWVLGTFTP